jgi:hypothetical protein
MTADVLGILGFAISVGLAFITIWDKLLRRARFRLSAEWMDAGQGVIEIDVSNTGTGKGSIRTFQFQAPAPRVQCREDGIAATVR